MKQDTPKVCRGSGSNGFEKNVTNFNNNKQ